MLNGAVRHLGELIGEQTAKLVRRSFCGELQDIINMPKV
jgi:hypothetical protein